MISPSPTVMSKGESSRVDAGPGLNPNVDAVEQSEAFKKLKGEVESMKKDVGGLKSDMGALGDRVGSLQ
eukprot:12402755-Karenia_brevis.AAC.1